MRVQGNKIRRPGICSCRVPEKRESFDTGRKIQPSGQIREELTGGKASALGKQLPIHLLKTYRVAELPAMVLSYDKPWYKWFKGS
jgi:hypothetical protein